MGYLLGPVFAEMLMVELEMDLMSKLIEYMTSRTR